MTPTTKAGRALMNNLYDATYDLDQLEAILAIEAEARQQERERIRATLPDKRWDDTPDGSGFDWADGFNSALESVLAILAEPTDGR